MSHLPRHDSSASVLLDLDGTLVASRDGIVSCLRLALQDLGHASDLTEDLTWVVGPPLHDIVANLLAPHGDDRLELAIARYKHHYEGGGLFESPLFPGIADAVSQLARSGRRLFLATSKPLHTARRILDARGLTDFFSGLYGARPDDSGAEKPELIARLIECERIHPMRAIMVGDRRFDISGAHANNMRALGVLWGYGGREELERAGAEALVESPDDLVGMVDVQLAAGSMHL
jgi:phosphoglycolate phosphatase